MKKEIIDISEMNNAQHGIKDNYFKLKKKDMEDNNLLKKINKKQGKGKKYIKKSVLQKRLEINKAASKQFIAEYQFYHHHVMFMKIT